MKWFYALNNQQIGPVSEAEFAALVAAGTILPDTLVWREGLAGWMPYSAAGHVPRTPSLGLTDPAVPGAGTDLDYGKPRAPLTFEFTGKWEEYFKIWIINILLTIATLGIYAAWAKVRTRRYFHANTRIAGHTFEYLADPVKILIGNLIIGGVFLLNAVASAISPLIQVPIVILIFFAVPWVIARALLFNARNSAWRGIRFGFTGTYGGAFQNFILWPMLITLTLGLIFPLVALKQKTWVLNHHKFGRTPFSFSGDAGAFYKIYLLGALFFIPLLLSYGGFIATMISLAAKNGGGQPDPEALGMAMGAMFLFIIPSVLAAFIGAQFIRARLFVYIWNRVALGPHRFEAKMRARDLIGLQLLNLVVTSVTAGFMKPWAIVRTVEFQLKALTLVPGGDIDAFVAEAQQPVSALGDSASDFLDVDLGFGV